MIFDAFNDTTLAYYLQINITCILLLSILGVAAFRHYLFSTRGKIFFTSLCVAILLCLSDIGAACFRGQTFAGATFFVWFFNILYSIAVVALGLCWILFSMLLLRQNIVKRLAIPVTVVGAILVVMICLTPLNGWFFVIDADNIYHRGELLWIIWAFVFFCQIVPFVAAIFIKAEMRARISIFFFPIAPIVATILQAIFYGVSAAQAGITISLLFISVVFQHNEMNEHRIKLELYNELCNTDPLTSLNNRRAFNGRVKSLASVEWVGVVFLDLNGLKSVNDHFGHEAGDNFIVSICEILKKQFPAEDIYRISGDEFVILSEDSLLFRGKVNDLIAEIGKMAAIGHRCGVGSDAEKLIISAEKAMYRAKNKYYKDTGLSRRRDDQEAEESQ